MKTNISPRKSEVMSSGLFFHVQKQNFYENVYIGILNTFFSKTRDYRSCITFKITFRRKFSQIVNR